MCCLSEHTKLKPFYSYFSFSILLQGGFAANNGFHSRTVWDPGLISDLIFFSMPHTHLKRVIQPVHWDRVHSTDNLQNTIEIIEVLENLQDFYDPAQHSHSLLKVLCFHDAPDQKIEFEKHWEIKPDILWVIKSIFSQENPSSTQILALSLQNLKHKFT